MGMVVRRAARVFRLSGAEQQGTCNVEDAEGGRNISFHKKETLRYRSK
jgi:hypothetical protein